MGLPTYIYDYFQSHTSARQIADYHNPDICCPIALIFDMTFDNNEAMTNITTNVTLSMVIRYVTLSLSVLRPASKSPEDTLL